MHHNEAEAALNVAALNLVVLAGGDSAEREVSLESGRCVAEALRDRGHQVLILDPAVESLNGRNFSEFDAIFPMLHGTGGEDGTLQLLLERLKIPFVGSSATASALTFDKAATREILQAKGLPVAEGLCFKKSAAEPRIHAFARQLGYPVVVKPTAQGSSVGVSIVSAESGLSEAVSEARRWGDEILLERYIAGREVTVPIVDGEVFPVIEICPARTWFDYEAKYNDSRTQYRLTPRGLPENVGDLALAACEACGVSAISRVDFRIDPEGRSWILEINTIPGMTSHSLVPMSAAAAGVTLGELCERSVRRALDAFRRGERENRSVA